MHNKTLSGYCVLATECVGYSTGLREVAGVSSEAIWADADEGVVSDAIHTRTSIIAEVHLTIIAWISNKQGRGEY